METWALIAWLATGTSTAVVTQTFETLELCQVAGKTFFDAPRYRAGMINPGVGVGGNYVCVQRRWRTE